MNNLAEYIWEHHSPPRDEFRAHIRRPLQSEVGRIMRDRVWVQVFDEVRDLTIVQVQEDIK